MYGSRGIRRVLRCMACAAGITEMGGIIMYKANAKQVLIEDGRAVGVKLADGREYRQASSAGSHAMGAGVGVVLAAGVLPPPPPASITT